MARGECLKGDPKVGYVKVYSESCHAHIHTRTQVGLYKAHSPLGPLGFEGAQHRQTLRPSVDGIRSKALLPFGLQ